MAQRGWVLLLDWVTGPQTRFGSRILAGDSLPAGPLFFGTAALLQHVFGAAVGWLLPWLLVAIAGIGGARVLGPDVSLTTALTAATAAMWNPFVHERLYAGQLAVLAGYATLPHLLRASVVAVGRVPRQVGERRQGGARRRWQPLATLRSVGPTALVWSAAAAGSIHFVVLGGLVVLAAGIGGICTTPVGACTRRAAAIRVGAWLIATSIATAAVTACWLLPRLTDAPPTGDDRTAAVFATRPDRALGLLGGVAFQRGFWRSSPGEPGSALGSWWPLVGGVLAGFVIVGFVSLWSHADRSIAAGALLVGCLGWTFGQGASGVLGGLFSDFTHVPGMRVMREAGKFIALVTLGWIVGLAGFAEVLARQARSPVGHRGLRLWRSLAVLGIVAPVALTPGLAWGVGGRLAAVRYPAEWDRFSRRIGPDERVIVVPFSGYLNPGFTNNRIVRNPAGAYFGERVVLSDDADVAGLAPSARTTQLAAALTGPDANAALINEGITWVILAGTRAIPGGLDVVERSNGWALAHVHRQPES
jgi:hypothetical protein